jgi:hypothetical protein
MRKHIILILSMMLGISVMAQQTIQLRSANKAECVKSDMKSLQASFSFSTIEAWDYESERGTFSWLSLPNTVLGGNVGDPQIPVFNELITVPFGAQPRIEVKSYTTTDYRLDDYGIHTIVPRQPSLRQDQKPEDVPFVMNEAAYQTRGFRSEPRAIVGVEGVMRGVQVGKMTIDPVSYDPVNNTLRVFNDIEVEVHFDGADAKATEDILLKTYSPYFNIVYKQLFNGKAVQDVYSEHPDLYTTPVKMLVVTTSKFSSHESFQQWVDWKTQKGFYVDVQTVADDASSNAIRSLIQQKYNADHPTFLVIVGALEDVTKSEYMYVDDDPFVTDIGYASMDGDWYHDLYMSRIPVNYLGELELVVIKTLAYEQYTMEDPSYLDHSLLIAGWDSNWGMTGKIGKPSVQYANHYYYNAAHGITPHVYITTGSNQPQCYNDLNDVGFIYYQGHGDETDWYDPKLTSNILDDSGLQLWSAISGQSRNFFWTVANCCLSANWGFRGEAAPPMSFAEVMLTTTPNLGYIGSVPETYWYEGYYWAVGATNVFSQMPTQEQTATGIFDAMFDDTGFNTMNSVPFIGNIAVCHAHAQGCTSDVEDYYYWKAFHCLGDGSLMPYHSVPAANTVSHEPTMGFGVSSFTVSADPGSYVALTKDNLILGVAEVDETGTVEVPITPVYSLGEVKLVVTRNQRQPYITTVPLTLDEPVSEINTEYDWNVFAFSVTNGLFDYQGLTVNLNADLSVSMMVGESEAHSFQGTFEGNGHTLTFNATTDENVCAPFRFTKNATIQHLHTTGVINTSAQFAGGIIGRAYCGGNLIDCHSSMEINSTKEGDGTHGGMIAVVNHPGGDQSIHNNANITGCLFDGKLVTTNGTTNCGGFVGFSHYNYVAFHDCLFAPSEVTTSMGGATFGRSSNAGTYVTFDNSYYKTAFGTAQGIQSNSIASGEFVTINLLGTGTYYSASGISAYSTGLKLNDEVLYVNHADEVSLNLHCDVPFGYLFNCFTVDAGTLIGTENPFAIAMNDADVVVSADIYVPELEGEGTEELPYIILYYTQLDRLAHQVNEGNEYSGTYFKLGADIEYYPDVLTIDHDGDGVNESNYTPIGTEDHHFRGHLDGDGHTISGIRLVGSTYQGLFGNVTLSKIKNIILADADITGHSYTGGIAGNSNGGTITNCHVTSTVTLRAVQTSVRNHGGIVGYNYIGTITHCSSSATLTIENGNNDCENYGGIVGYNNYGTITDNFAINAIIPVTNHYFGAILGSYNTGNNTGTMQRNYYHNCTVTGYQFTTQIGCAGNDLNNTNNPDGAVVSFLLTLADGITSSATVITIPEHKDLNDAGTAMEPVADITYFVARYGSTVTLDYQLPEGYTFEYYTIRGEAIEGNSFYMPQNNVIVGMEVSVEGWTGNLTISGYGDSDCGYVLIATPVGTVSPENVTHMLENDYDLYAFNQAEELEWRNYKANNFELEPSKGYLYANSEDVTLTFNGTPYCGNGEVTLAKTDGVDFSGWNLVGNPFAVNAYIADGRPFYTMNDYGSEIMAAETNSIAPMEGVFVIAQTNEEIMNFTTTDPANNGKSILSLNLSQGRGVIDRAIVRFGEGGLLPKFQLNRISTKVYIPMDGQDYAVVRSKGMGEMPVSFKAKEDGSYTLSLSSEEVEFSYLHLIDNMTGADMDLLAAGPSTGSGTSYTFTAKTTDYESRFKLVFATKDSPSTPSTGSGTEGSFAFISDGNIIVNGEGVLQIIDVTGRIVVQGDAINRISTSGMTPGVYVLRLINGNDLKTQKIVVR